MYSSFFARTASNKVISIKSPKHVAPSAHDINAAKNMMEIYKRPKRLV
jgi:hypothetical protein